MGILRSWKIVSWEMMASYDAALKKASEQARKVAWVNTLG